MGDTQRCTEKLHRSVVRTFPARLPPRPRASFRREAEEDPDLLRSPHEPSPESGGSAPRAPRRCLRHLGARAARDPQRPQAAVHPRAVRSPGPRESRAPPPRPSPRRPAAPPNPHLPAAAGPSATCPRRRRRRRGPAGRGAERQQVEEDSECDRSRRAPRA